MWSRFFLESVPEFPLNYFRNYFHWSSRSFIKSSSRDTSQRFANDFCQNFYRVTAEISSEDPLRTFSGFFHSVSVGFHPRTSFKAFPYIAPSVPPRASLGDPRVIFPSHVSSSSQQIPSAVAPGMSQSFSDFILGFFSRFLPEIFQSSFLDPYSG